MGLKILYAMQNTGADLTMDAGAPILIKRTITGLRQAGNDVRVLTLAEGLSVRLYADSTFDTFFDTFEIVGEGVTSQKWFLLLERFVRRVQNILKIPYIALFDTLRFYSAMIKQLEDVDVCHEYQALFSPGAILACRRKKIPLVVTVDADLLLERAVVGEPLRGFQAFVARAELRWLYHHARRIICVSDAAKKHFVSEWGVPTEKIKVLPNSVDTEVFNIGYDGSVIRTELGLHNEPVIGFVGSFQKWHGIEGLVEAFAMVQKTIPNVKLLLVGDGPARENVEAAIEHYGVGTDAIITGYIPQHRVPHYLAAIDVAVIPYPKLPQELWFSPLKLYEYMAAGKAIVASSGGQITQVLKSGETGILFEPGDISEMARSILRVLKDKKLRENLSQAARIQAEEQHSWQRYTEALEEIYQCVLNENQ